MAIQSLSDIQKAGDSAFSASTALKVLQTDTVGTTNYAQRSDGYIVRTDYATSPPTVTKALSTDWANRASLTYT